MDNPTYQPRVRVEQATFPSQPVMPKNKVTEKTTAVFSVLDKVIAGSIFMLFLGMPLFFTGLTLQGIVFEKQIYFYCWTFIALICWAGKGVMTGEMKIRKTPLDIPIGIFWAIYLLATVISVDRWHSFFGFFGDPSRGFMSVTTMIIAYYLIMSNFSLRLFRLVAAAILFSAVFISLWSLSGVFGIHILSNKIAAYAPLSLIGSTSGLGMFLAVVLPLLVTAVFKLRTSKIGRISREVLTGIFLAGIVADMILLLALFGFIPWIGLMIGFGFFLIFILSRVVRPNEKWTWLPSGIFIVLMVILMSGSNFDLAQVELPVEVGPSYSLSWEIAKESLKEDFVLGSGAASYGHAFSLYKPEIFNQNQLYNLRFYQGYGVIFEAISSVGVLGTLALLLLIFSFVSVCIYLLAIRKEKDKIYSLGFITASLIFLISAILVRTEGTMIIFGALLLSLSLAVVIRESESEEAFFYVSLKASPKYALTLAFIFMVVSAGVVYLFVFVGKIYAADIFAGKALRQTKINDKQGSIEMMNKAIRLNSKESKYHMNVGQNYMILANEEMMKASSLRDINAVQAYLNQAIGAAVNGKNLSPNDVAAIESLAQIYENAGVYVADSLNLAEDAYKRGLELEPNNPNFILGLGKMRLSQAVMAKDEERKTKINEAREFFQKSIEKKADFAPGYYQLAIAQGALGDFDGAIESMTKAASLDKNNINYFFNLARLYQQRGSGDDEKIAESIFQKILGANDKEINTHFSLGTLYEKRGEKEKALDEYNKVLSLLSPENQDVSEKVREMIENLKNGTGNLDKSENQENNPVSEAEKSETLPK